MHVRIALVVCATLVGISSSENGDGCITRPFCASATKTPYSCIVSNSTAEKVVVPHCEAKQIWLIARHGTRYPSRKGVEHITEYLPKLAAALKDGGALCAGAVEAIEKWEHGLTGTEQAKKLHPEGEAEMVGIAERFQMRFPRLLDVEYNPVYFRFRSTATERSERSQFYFATGLFGRDVAQRVGFEASVKPHDPIIRFYKVCDKWRSEVKHNRSALVEMVKFEQSAVFLAVRKAVTARLGLEETIDLDVLEAIYVGCVFGQAWQPQRASPWCSVFHDSDLAVMEYREDLEAFWRDGYGNRVNLEPACVIMEDVFKTFRQKEKAGTFYFSHSGAILKFSSFLGLFKDEAPLRHDNFDTMGDRTYRTSANDALGSNVAFVLQECSLPVGPNKLVGMYFNERLTAIPGCGGELWCDYDKFEELFGGRVRDCDFAEICKVAKDASKLDDVETVDDEDKF
jgi:multiple inositol-polyphosphate phosphatase/2,3-bisphosphoglycerate 3-phosphatase